MSIESSFSIGFYPDRNTFATPTETLLAQLQSLRTKNEAQLPPSRYGSRVSTRNNLAELRRFSKIESSSIVCNADIHIAEIRIPTDLFRRQSAAALLWAEYYSEQDGEIVREHIPW